MINRVVFEPIKKDKTKEFTFIKKISIVDVSPEDVELGEVEEKWMKKKYCLNLKSKMTWFGNWFFTKEMSMEMKL